MGAAGKRSDCGYYFPGKHRLLTFMVQMRSYSLCFMQILQKCSLAITNYSLKFLSNLHITYFVTPHLNHER